VISPNTLLLGAFTLIREIPTPKVSESG